MNDSFSSYVNNSENQIFFSVSQLAVNEFHVRYITINYS